MIPIDVLVKPVTSDDVFEGLLNALEAVEIPARSWKEGGVARSILGVVAEFGAMGASVVTSCVAGGFLNFATGRYLTAHAEDVYGVERISSTAATGEVTLSNTSGASYSVGANELVVRSSNTFARFRVTEAFVLSSGSEATPTTITVDVSAIEPGADSSVAPAEIDELETPLAGVSVTNESSLVGRDEESDDDLRTRCLAKKGTWSPFGPRDAYEYAALTATLDGGAPTSITRVSVSRESSTGRVIVICATPSGGAVSEELQAVRDSIETYARPDSVTCQVFGASPVATTHTIKVWCRGGTVSLIESRVQAALAAFYSTYPIGGIAKVDGGQGYLYADAIEAAIIGASPEIFDVDDVGDDIELDFDQVAVNTTTLDVRIR